MGVDERLIPRVDASKCCLSKECIMICPQGAIKVVGGAAAIDPDLCDGDGLCLAACPHNAIFLPGA